MSASVSFVLTVWMIRVIVSPTKSFTMNIIYLVGSRCLMLFVGSPLAPILESVMVGINIIVPASLLRDMVMGISCFLQHFGKLWRLFLSGTTWLWTYLFGTVFTMSMFTVSSVKLKKGSQALSGFWAV